MILEPVTNELIDERWCYKGNFGIRRAGVKYPYEEHHIAEIQKCSNGFDGCIYFIRNYVKIINLDNGLVPFLLHDYQVKMIENMYYNRFNIIKNPRQSGKTTTTGAFYNWKMNFFPYEMNGIVANKEEMAIEIIERIQRMQRYLPLWLQQGVIELNKTKIRLENGSETRAAATSHNSLRGFSIKNLFWDEAADISKNLAEGFLSSIYPTISSAQTTSITVSSTPKGANHFYKFWKEAKNDANGYIPFEIKWNDVPGRDEKFKKMTISQIGQRMWDQEYECKFIGSESTLISSIALESMAHDKELNLYTIAQEHGYFLNQSNITNENWKGLSIYELPKKDHFYILVVDTAKGVEQDYNTISVIDVSENQWQQIATYRNNIISYLLFPDIIFAVGKFYGQKYTENVVMVIETNEFGHSVVLSLHSELETECYIYSPDPKELGFHTTTKTKRLGARQLQRLIEDNKLKISDFNTINELYTFEKKGNSFKASEEEGATDDLVMGLVNFSYFTTTQFFKDYVLNSTMRLKLYSDKQKQIDNEVPPFGFIVDGTEIDEEITKEDPDERDSVFLGFIQ